METLQQLAEQVERLRQICVLKDSLDGQIMELQKKVSDLKARWRAEEADVERLKKIGLTAVFYEIIGKKEEKLEQEQREALAAAAKYQAAQAELDGLWQQREVLRAEQSHLHGCKERFETAKAARAAELRDDPELGGKILELEAQQGRITGQKRELREAVEAGNRALQITREVQKELDSAESWGTWDMLGGGMLTQMAKHGHLDSAQSMIHDLQNQLRQFKTELADVDIHGELNIQVDEFLRFADWFFDGLIVDWTVQDRIEQAKDDVNNTAWQIQSYLNRLERLETDLLRQENRVRDELEALILP